MLKAHLDSIIGRMLDDYPQLSDIVFTADKPPQVEVHGRLQDYPLDTAQPRLAPFQSEAVAISLMGRNTRLYQDLLSRGSCDLSYALSGRARFRVNIFSQRGSMCTVMRQLPSAIPSVDDLGLPPVFKEMSDEKFGLVLVTGATGTGKTTSLAALVDRINSVHPVHIVTLEDPVEFAHAHKNGTVSQRELGIDFDSFASGLRAALRQAPKVILVGEIRDRETMEIAMQAAETGHLVLGTLHTTDAGRTINRIIGFFDPQEELLVRARLAESLKAVVSQRLLPRAAGGRIAVFEVLKNNLRIKELVLTGESEQKTFLGVLASSGAFGMNTFDQYIAQLYRQGVITEQAAVLGSTDKALLTRMIDRIKTERGEKVTSIEGLSIDHEYETNI